MSKAADERVTMTPTEKLPDELQAVLDEDAAKRRPATEDMTEDLAQLRRRIEAQKPKTARLTRQISALRALVVGAS